MIRVTTRSLAALLFVTAFTAACSNNDNASDGAGASGGAAATSSSSSASSSNSTGTGGSAPRAEIITALDATKSELPEGLTTRGTDAFIGLSVTGAIDRLPLAGGAQNAYASVPPPPPNTSFLLGLTFDSSDRLLAGVASFTPDLAAGVYRSPAGGGPATLWASHTMMVFPNGLVWDSGGNLFVADSSFGGIFKVTPDGTATPWISDPILTGDPTSCGGASTDLTIGANGIAYTNGVFYVSSSNKGILAKVPVNADGTAGAVETIAGPDCALKGIDGITLDDDGSIVAAINSNRIARIDPKSGHVTTVVEGAPLDFPASVAFAGTGADRALYVTNFALGNALAMMPAKPGLVRIRF